MKPVFELGTEDVRVTTISLTGDGRRELLILKAMAERYNGNNLVLQLPAIVAPLGHGNKQTGRFIGFSVLQTIKTYVTKYHYNSFLFLVDKEHVKDVADFASEIKQKIVGFVDVIVDILGSQTFLVNCTLGGHNIAIRVVVCGKQKCIEENIAALILLEYGLTVEPKKPSIDGILKQKGITLYRLIRHAKKEHIENAFSELAGAFLSIEQSSHVSH